jgi:hypothetical protein
MEAKAARQLISPSGNTFHRGSTGTNAACAQHMRLYVLVKFRSELVDNTNIRAGPAVPVDRVSHIGGAWFDDDQCTFLEKTLG